MKVTRELRTYIYGSNNSGGHWWLTDEDWRNLELNGWLVYWGGWNKDYTDRKYKTAEEAEHDRWLGCLAKMAEKDFYSEEDAIREFEEITNQDYEDEGCYCCGEPHSIYEKN